MNSSRVATLRQRLTRHVIEMVTVTMEGIPRMSKRILDKAYVSFPRKTALKSHLDSPAFFAGDFPMQTLLTLPLRSSVNSDARLILDEEHVLSHRVSGPLCSFMLLSDPP